MIWMILAVALLIAVVILAGKRKLLVGGPENEGATMFVLGATLIALGAAAGGEHVSTKNRDWFDSSCELRGDYLICQIDQYAYEVEPAVRGSKWNEEY